MIFFLLSQLESYTYLTNNNSLKIKYFTISLSRLRDISPIAWRNRQNESLSMTTGSAATAATHWKAAFVFEADKYFSQ